MGNDSLNGVIKGLPYADAAGRTSGVDGNWNVLAEDLPLPVALLRRSALENNRRWIRAFLDRTNAKFAPHGKTHMSPELFQMQLADGAWAITLATVHQVTVARAAGVKRIVLANQVVGQRDLDYLFEALSDDPALDLYCLVDSLSGVDRLRAAADRAPSNPRQLKLLLELGYEGGRAGSRTLNDALTVARALKGAHPRLALAGVEGFEGLLLGLPPSESVPRVRRFLAEMVALAKRIDQDALFAPGEDIILSAGGSAYYDLVVEAFGAAKLSRDVSIVLRSGCYLTHDTGIYDRLFGDILERSDTARAIGSRYESALEVWAYVISLPEPGRAILGAGRRDFGHDLGNPTPLKQFRPAGARTPHETPGFRIDAVNDQHAHMSFPTSADVRVGDLIGLGVSHPCTTFDKWRVLHLVDDDYSVVSSIRTCF